MTSLFRLVCFLTVFSVTLEQNLNLNWNPCSANTIYDTTVDYSSLEDHLNMPMDPLKPKPSDSTFTKNLKEILIRQRYHTFGVTSVRGISQSVPIGLVSECTTPTIPYYNNATKGTYYRSLNYFVKRYRALDGMRMGAIIMLQGGPGFGEDALEPMALQLWAQMNGKFDIILPDHRGTARSTPLFCRNGTSYQSIINACQANIASRGFSSNLDGFTADEASLDTINLIRTIKKQNGGLAYLYGVSYGTYVVHRMLQYDNNIVDAVIMDGICGGKYCNFSKADFTFDRVGRDFLSRCGNDQFCSSKLGTTDQILKKLEQLYQTNNKCTDIFTSVNGDKTLKSFFTTALMDATMRLLIPVIIYRSLRCSAIDQMAIPLMISNLNNWLKSLARPGYPVALGTNYNIGISELGGTTGNITEIENFTKTCAICNGASVVYPSLFKAGWKTYPESLYANSYANYSKPLLLLNGNLDPQTSIYEARAFASQIKPTAPNLRLLEFNDVVHYVLGTSSVAGNDNSICGLNIAVQFFNDPQNIQNLNTSCMNNLLGLPFAGYATTQMYIAIDMWEGSGLDIEEQNRLIIGIVIGTVIGVILLLCFICCTILGCYIFKCGCFRQKYTRMDLDEPLNTEIPMYYRKT